MKPVLATAGFALTLMAGVVAANAANTVPAETGKPPAYADPVIADADAMKAADALHHTNIRKQLQDQLAQAGYSDVKVTPAAFFIQAKDKKGRPVAMVVGPDSFTEVTDLLTKPAGGMAQAPSTTMQKK